MFHGFDRDKWGSLILYGDVHSGYAGSAYQLLIHDGMKKVVENSIMAEAESTGTLNDCSENFHKGCRNTATEQRKCLSELYSLSSRIRMLKDGKASAGFYPPQLTVFSFGDSKKYTNKAFTAAYNSARGYYNIPKDHPLIDKNS